jgi:membrane associated rhomboid family serine protease
VSTGGPDLFVICKSCGSEVSPYITECPYCGNRLRKRAPKLDRDGRINERRRRRPTPSLPRLRPGEMPGIRPESRPYGMVALVLLGIAGCLVFRTKVVNFEPLVVIGKPGHDWWRLLTAPFIYDNTGFAFATLGATALYGWLLERRHGPLPVLLLFLIGAVGGTVLSAAVYTNPIVLGGNGGALALLCAWAIPDLLRLRAGEEIDGDLLGTLVIGVVVALMPLADAHAAWLADAVGVATGLTGGLLLARLRPA